MSLDASTCYAALGTRDPRFDGRFFIAVRTTGIYCRPICPARTPKPENVTFYATPAAAEEAGFRPCRRCRPESAPRSPAWLGTSATVTRALRLLAGQDNASEDDPPIAALAARLGVGERHLRRLFAEHVGASPRAVLTSRRVHFARRLLDETALPVEDVARAAGFGSGRRLRAALTRTFGRGPAALRGSTRTTGSAEETPIELTLPFVPPYDWAAMLTYRGARAIQGVERVDAARGTYVRTIDGGGVLEVRRASESTVLLRLWDAPADDLYAIVERVRHMLDLDADSATIDRQLARDRTFRAHVRRHPGLRLPAAWDPFELAVRAILGQQVSVRAASTLCTRLVERIGTRDPRAEAFGLTHRFPAADALADAGAARLKTLGLTTARAATLASFAASVSRDPHLLAPVATLDGAVERLTALPGIGPWTAHYVALRGFGEPDAFPEADLGLRKALAPAGEAPLTPRAALERVEALRPWRGYAALHLWLGDA